MHPPTGAPQASTVISPSPAQLLPSQSHKLQVASALRRQRLPAPDVCARCMPIGAVLSHPSQSRSSLGANRRLRRCFGIGCRVVCRAFSGDANNMAAESGSDFQQRRRRRRDPEESEKTELSERELAVAVAVSQENDEENEERWVGPLPVEATLAKKRKGSCRHSTGRIGVLHSPSGRVEFKPDPKRDGVWSFVPSEQRAVLSLLATPYLHVLTK